MKNDLLLKSKITEANVLLTNKDLEGVGKLLNEIDFMLGKHDDYISQLTEVFTKMADFDFSQRLQIVDDSEEDLSALLSRGLNWLNEEFEAVAIHKDIVDTVFDTIDDRKDSLMVITDVHGNIKFLNKGSVDLPGFKESLLIGKPIHEMFEDFKYVDESIKKGHSTRHIPILFKWKEQTIPSSLNIGFSSRLGKIEASIYYIKFAPGWRQHL